MKRLDELFNSARNAQPPLSRKEAGDILNNVGTVIKPAKGSIALKKVFLIITPVITTACIAFILATSPHNKTWETIDKQALTENLAPNGSNYPETGITAENLKKENDNKNKNKPGISGNEPGHIYSPADNQFIVNNISEKNKINIHPVNEIPDKNKPVKPQQPVKNTEKVAQGSIPVVEHETDEDTVVQETANAVLNEDIPAGDSSLKKHRTVSPVLYRFYPRVYLKTDLAGYFYNLFPGVFFGTSYIDPKPVSGNKYMLGVEAEITRRFSAGANLSYGFAPYSQASATITEDVFGRFETEHFRNFKGWSLILDARYYITKNGRSGLFAGIYTGWGWFQERIFLRGKYQPGTHTLNTSRGYSWGLGFNAGYKLMLGNFYIEPNIGFIATGNDKKYYNWTYKGQEYNPRYRAMNRYELNIGMAF